MHVHERIDDKVRAFIAEQKMFFVATAPLSGDGSVNMSPKGYDSLVVLDDHTVAYIDLGGSGVETVAHVRENGRITLMFCAFDGKPNILRLYGKGEAVTFDNEVRFNELLKLFPTFDRARAIIVVSVTRVQDSCGWGVPFYEFKSERDQLRRYVDHRSYDEWAEHRYDRNALSIDGLPGLIKPPTEPK